MPAFQFQQFSVQHDRSSMKVGTDAVLLGAWVDVSNTAHILDVGTGSGVIALMLAQRTTASVSIDAVEPDAGSCADAADNFSSSPWSSRLRLHQSTIQEYHPVAHYDLIVSNPPYFRNSLLPPSASRASARHTDLLNYEELIATARRLLTPWGRLAVVLPAVEGVDFRAMAKRHGFVSVRSDAVYSRAEKPQERWLLELSRQGLEGDPGTLVLHEEGDGRSAQYQALTGDFYLLSDRRLRNS